MKEIMIEAAKKLSELLGCFVVPSHPFVKYDLNILKKNEEGVKRVVGCALYARSWGNDTETFKVNKKKLDHMYFMKTFLGVHTLLIVQFNDRVARLDINPITWEGYPLKLPYEPLGTDYAIPTNLFKTIKG